ncbi:MAG: IS256 family transposase [Candidatus Zixiibacteriota bacterium]
MSKYKKLTDSTREKLPVEATDLTGDLDTIAREGARRMLVSVLESEVTEFLGRQRYERKEESPGYRNGHGKQRRVTLGTGTVTVRAPRVRDSVERFASQVLPAYQRRSNTVKELLPELYVQGLATGDFEPALRGLLGEHANLSPSTVVRLKEHWESEYEAWRKRSLANHQYAYLWCDGVYPKAGLQGDKTAFLVVLGVNENGEKEPLAIVEGYRESTESWAEVLRDLKARGLTDPKLFGGDGALGLWGAIDKVYPKADHQRCWVHKMRNIMIHFPKRLHAEVKLLLRQMYDADTRKQSEVLMAQFAEVYGRDYPRAVECLLKDQDALLTYFKYPKEHWVSLKTTNPIESIFATVKLRTNAARRIKSPRSALYLIFQLIIRAQNRWQRLHAPHLVRQVLDGVKFEDGIEIRKTKNNQTEKSVA